MRKNKPKFYIVIFIVLILAVLGFLLSSLFNFSAISDWLDNLGYTPTPEVLALEEKIGLTSSAKSIFRATEPTLETREDFNEHCKSYDVDISVLGCYTNDQIYLYNIEAPELDGIVESTAAHEFLHAAWDRLADAEKNKVAEQLTQVYNANKAALDADLELYDTAEQLDELHSRIGVQIADLPEELESYYARYFTDQDAVVKYYDNYIAPFEALRAETEELKATIDDLKETLDSKTEEYYKRAEQLSAQINEFNTCADTLGCFASTTDFYARRAELVAEQEALEELYEDTNGMVEEYNKLVEEYNNDILRTETLQNAINSNAKVESLEN